jgi:hypothetical protein
MERATAAVADEIRRANCVPCCSLHVQCRPVETKTGQHLHVVSVWLADQHACKSVRFVAKGMLAIFRLNRMVGGHARVRCEFVTHRDMCIYLFVYLFNKCVQNDGGIEIQSNSVITS